MHDRHSTREVDYLCRVTIRIVGCPVRMGWEVISIQNGGGILTSSITRARMWHESRTSAKA